MFSAYINGSILEMLERVKALKTKIPIARLPDSFHQLASGCLRDIDEVIAKLESLIHDQRYQVESNLARKIVDFQAIVKDIDYLENKIVAPLQRFDEDDEKATKFVKRICKEINYPLLPPVVSRLSQEYYCIDAKFNHMRAPLLEAEFLLHLPDIYHELCHPIIDSTNDPRTEKYLEQLSLFIEQAESHCAAQIIQYKKNDGEEEAQLLETCNKSWVKWGIELSCDLFATYAVGPAYAWANLHLCLKKGGNAFQTPRMIPSSHPANDARMMAMLAALDLIGCKEEAGEIKRYWEAFLPLAKSKSDARYKIAFPGHLLEQAAIHTLEGTKAINVRIYQKEEHSSVRELLNEAWKKFMRDPIDYIGWEKLKREEFNVL